MKSFPYEQGSNLGEPSEIFVKLATSSRKEIQRVYVGAEGILRDSHHRHRYTGIITTI